MPTRSEVETRAFLAAYGRFGQQERRTFALDHIKARSTTATASTGSGLQIIGHAAVYEQPSMRIPSQVGDFIEYIAAGAFDAVLATSPDVLCTVEHDTKYVLGRTTNGTLELSSNAHGLRYWCRAAPTTYAQDLKILMDRGDVNQSSFSFTVAPGGEKWDVRSKGNVTRTITRVAELFDVCVTPSGQYPQADSAARSLAIDYALARGFIEQDPAVALHRARLAAELDVRRRRLHM